MICEFVAMLKALQTGRHAWMGREFFGYTGKGRMTFNFRRRSNGIVLAFSAEERGELMGKARALPKWTSCWKMRRWCPESSQPKLIPNQL